MVSRAAVHAGIHDALCLVWTLWVDLLGLKKDGRAVWSVPWGS